MLRTVLMLCVLVVSTLRCDEIHQFTSPEGSRTEESSAGRRAEVDKPERTYKMGKKSFGYAVIAAVVKSLLLIKFALAKLAILGNISIMLSKLSLILSLLLTFSKYFSGIGKMLKLKSLGHEEHSTYHYPAHEDHGNYVT